MIDISKCSGLGCPMKKRCYRFMAKSDTYQSFFTKPPIKKGKCEYYWKDINYNSKGIKKPKKYNPKDINERE
jgi:hypothetical protein